MPQSIDKLKTIPGVFGACLYSPEFGLQENNLPEIFEPEKLSMIGSHLTKLHTTARISFTDLNDLTLDYDELVVVVRELNKEQLIFIICDPSFNHNLLSMSLNLLKEEVDGSLNDVAAITPLEEHPAETDTGIETEKVDSQDMMVLLDNLSDRLLKIMGPMAGFIFDEAFDEWKNQGPVVSSRIDKLLTLLDSKIDDPEKIEQYRELIKPSLHIFQER